MRIGVVPALDPRSGGMHQYSMTMLDQLDRMDLDDHFVVFASDVRYHFLNRLSAPRWSVVPLDPPSLKGRIRSFAKLVVPEGEGRDLLRQVAGGHQQVQDVDQVRDRSDLRAWFEANDIDLMLYPAPLTYAFEAGVPFVMAVHDLQHRLQPEFPEVSADGEWETREYLFRNAARDALLLLADSAEGAQDIMREYADQGVAPERVAVLPFLPAPDLLQRAKPQEVTDVCARYELPDRYLFYPGQFWPHKNHKRVVEALVALGETGLRVPLVLTGSFAGRLRQTTFDEMMRLASEGGIREDIHYLGYVGDGDMRALYAAADGLVMPTFFGPTNIPVVEAWASDCPVITSDIRGIREQVGDAAVLVDPRDPVSIARGIRQVWTDEERRDRLRQQGRTRLHDYTPEDYRRRLGQILSAAKRAARQAGPSLRSRDGGRAGAAD